MLPSEDLGEGNYRASAVAAGCASRNTAPWSACSPVERRLPPLERPIWRVLGEKGYR